MKLLFLIIISTAQVLFIKYSFLKNVSAASQTLQNWALTPLLAHPTDYNWFYSAILFGIDQGLRQKPEIKATITLGLYHLIVVSGSHLVALEKILSLPPLPAKLKNTFSFLGLLLFTAANLFQPACLRAFLQWALQKYFKEKNHHSFDLILIAALICISLEPSYTQSTSLQLSFAASIALTFSNTLGFKIAGKTFLCILFTLPFIMQFQPCVSAFVFVLNIIALPLLEVTLLPLSLFLYFFGFLRPHLEFILKNFFEVTMQLSGLHVPSFCFEQQRSSQWGFMFLVLFYFFSRYLAIKIKRSLFFGTLAKET